MNLAELLHEFGSDIRLSKKENVPVTGVQEDSRQVGPGNVFVARTGGKNDGAAFAADAVSRGAVAVVCQKKNPQISVPQVVVNDVNSAASKLAEAFWQFPSRTVKVLGITGTNGKTTTTYLIRHLLRRVGHKCGLIGTVEIDDGKRCAPAEMTTPSGVEVARVLAAMRDNGCWSCAMETSSHALDQSRVAGIEFTGAAFTNLTGDHLDYHKTMENYAAAKAKLFESLPAGAVGVFNADDPHAERIIRGSRARLISFGIKNTSDYSAEEIHVSSQGSSFTLVAPDGEGKVRMSLIGRHNIENALAAAALVGETYQLPVQQLAAALGDAAGAPGRLQRVDAGQKFAVLVDYAHTDDALKNVLSALAPLTEGKLRALFGCGGDRDKTKRPRMARIARKYADEVYVTSDNPRTEDPDAIIADILPGFGAKYEPAFVDSDRRAAIARILNDARDGDIVLLAGKGHENYQVVGTTKHHFDDAEEARAVLQSTRAAA